MFDFRTKLKIFEDNEINYLMSNDVIIQCISNNDLSIYHCAFQLKLIYE